MTKAVIFPGQGSQYKGMGRELFEMFPDLTHSAILKCGYDIVNLCLDNPEEKLNATEYTQPAIYLVSCLSYLKYKNENELAPDFLCGHSLGEYSALFAAEVFDLLTGLEIVNKRGNIMGKAMEGSMIVVIGNDIDKVHTILQENNLNKIYIANYNSYEQIVLSGNATDLYVAEKILTKLNFVCFKLNVSGAFHSGYMLAANEEFLEFLKGYSFNKPQIKLFSAITLGLLKQEDILPALRAQLVSSVKWLQAVNLMCNMQVDTFIEMEPGKVLTRLNNKILSRLSSSSHSA